MALPEPPQDLVDVSMPENAVSMDDLKASSSVVPESEIKMIRRKLNTFVGFANLPKQWHRKSIKRGFNLNVMVVGEKGLGKSTLLNTLFNKDLYPSEMGLTKQEGVSIDCVSAEIEENGVKLHLTIIDTPGFGDSIDNTDSWKPIVDEINKRFDNYLQEESKITRATVPDDRVHACLYFIEPTGHSLKPLDITFMKKVHDKVNLIPVIAKSDALTEDEIVEFKQRILDDIHTQGINVFHPPQYDNDDEEALLSRQKIMSEVPFAVVGSTTEIQTQDGRVVRGRNYPWGVIEVDNEDHCDFIKLRQLLIRNFMEELKEHTANVLYEKYRTERLIGMGINQDDTVFREFDPSSKDAEEKAFHEAALARLEAKMKETFQEKVQAKEKKLQQSEAELFSKHEELKEKLMKEIKSLEEKKRQLESARAVPQPDPAPSKTRKFLR